MKKLSDKWLISPTLSVRKGKMTHFMSHFFVMFQIKLYKYDLRILKFIKKQAGFLDKKNGGWQKVCIPVTLSREQSVLCRYAAWHRQDLGGCACVLPAACCLVLFLSLYNCINRNNRCLPSARLPAGHTSRILHRRSRNLPEVFTPTLILISFLFSGDTRDI